MAPKAAVKAEWWRWALAFARLSAVIPRALLVADGLERRDDALKVFLDLT
jgi:hypothetical protein